MFVLGQEKAIQSGRHLKAMLDRRIRDCRGTARLTAAILMGAAIPLIAGCPTKMGPLATQTVTSKTNAQAGELAAGVATYWDKHGNCVFEEGLGHQYSTGPVHGKYSVTAQPPAKLCANQRVAAVPLITDCEPPNAGKPECVRAKNSCPAKAHGTNPQPKNVPRNAVRVLYYGFFGTTNSIDHRNTIIEECLPERFERTANELEIAARPGNACASNQCSIIRYGREYCKLMPC